MICPRKLLFGMLFAIVAANTGGAAELSESVMTDFEQRLRPLFEHFHANPELSFLEQKTAKRMADELRALGVEVTEGVGDTGVVGMLRNGDGPLVLVRADMDGLPVKEDTGLAYASEARQVDQSGNEVPVMHACGHDVHITSMIGTAKQLADRRDAWSGTVMFVVQPAEEKIGGAKAMLADGLYARFGVPDFALAFHVSAGEPGGMIEITDGPISASSDSVDIIVRGVGAHGASPHQGKDPIYIGSQIVVALQGLVSRELPPRQPGVVTVGSFHGGFKHNIIGDEAKLELTIRSQEKQVRDQLLAGIERIAEGVGRTNGLPEELLPQVIHTGEETPPTINDAALCERLRSAIRHGMGADQLYESTREGMGAEDFAFFVNTEENVPGCYYSVGGTPMSEIEAAQRGGPPVASHHSPFFKIDPTLSVPAGVESMTLSVLELLGK